MKISFDNYNVFYYVAKFKSITSTANYLHVSQPAITRQIKNLEMNLGFTLFIRNSSGLKLTLEGEKLYKEVSKAIEIFNSVESKYNEFKPAEEGTIKVLSGYATTKNVLLPIITQFNKLYPKIKVFVEYYPFKEAISKLRNGEVDILLMNSEDHLEYADLEFTNFYTLNDVFIVSDTIKDKYPDLIKLEEINNYPIICKKDSNNARNYIIRFLNERGIEFKPTWELTDHWLVEEYIKMNMGIGIVSREFVQKDLDNGTLVEIKTDKLLPKRSLSYAIRKNSLLRPELIKLMHFFDNASKKYQK
ncbi:MAG: LysR family transcriptional regulator [Bacilli bacterium]|nr:LysR family transcriptional regulator [Bacilli bacterium]